MFDWSGQFGLETEKGRLLWNRSWTSGPIIMDGTFAYFPARYGRLISEEFSSAKSGSFPLFRTLPDTETVTSYLDYTRGDFLLDKLGIGVRSAQANSSVSLGMFKRDFAGREGQYLIPYTELPIQQSYKMDYRSHDSQNDIDVSVIRLITDVGMPDDSSTETGRYTDEILSGGMLWKGKSDQWDWIFQGSQFNQKLMMEITAYPTLGSLRLNRSQLHGRLIPKNTFLPVDYFGINIQSQSVGDTSIRSLAWNTVYTGWEGEVWNANVGFTLPSVLEEAQVYGELNHVTLLNGWHISSNALVESSPRHYMEWLDNPKLDYETWYTAHMSIAKTWQSFEMAGTISAGIREEDGFETPFISLGPTMKWEPFRRWILSGKLHYAPNPIRESDGIGLKAHIGIQGTEWLFRDNMKTTFYVWAEGAGMCSKTSVFHPFFQKPVSIGNETSVEDYGILNFRMDAVISSVRIRYQILNVLHAAYPTLSGWFSDFSEESTFMRPNPYLPKMGRRVSFSITWQFQD